MEGDRATRIIEDTFKQPFDERRFYEFSKNLLNNLDERHGFEYISNDRIKNIFKPHITKYKRLGTYQDPNGDKLDVMVVNLKNEWALERSRTMLRNFTADYLKSNDQKEAALVAYYTPNPDDWRFSYIHMEYKLEQSESGRIRFREDLTPAKRFSFMVGKNEPNHTAQEQLIPILEDDKNNPTISDLEKSFSVEAVTKQFYNDYRGLYEKLKIDLDRIIENDYKIAKEFETKSIETANFVKKLLGQIVFLYFLQKKGWLGVDKDQSGDFKPWGSGNKDFLRKLFNKNFVKENVNFFNDVLEPLFYDGLASEHENDFFPLLQCKIPFLNGGLFEPINGYNWQKTKILIGNELIEEVLDTFDRYNFTVREDEPLEKEVAVDPEMLGKVFENLINENERKGVGAFYTPRTIVHYMCQESLINYLNTTCELVSKEDVQTFIREGDIIEDLESVSESNSEVQLSVLVDSIKKYARELDDALTNIKVCDPAIGSGAFPVGMMTEIVKARHLLNRYLERNKSKYEFKRHCIQESLYGVDLDPGAIEIAKLRLWLSLIVDEEDYNNIHTLPNLDYKIMQGNSLIEEFHGISLDIEKKTDAQTDMFSGGSDLYNMIEDLHQKQDEFFNAEHRREKSIKRQGVENSIYNIFHHQLEKQQNVSPEATHAIETGLKEMTHGNKVRNFFPWKLYFADAFQEKGGFDVVIGNPPYGVSIRENYRNNVLKNLEKVPDYEIYYFFIELSHKLLKNNSLVTYIIPNTFLFNVFAKNYRSKLLKIWGINEILDCTSFCIFESATVRNSIINFSKNEQLDTLGYRNTKDINSFEDLVNVPRSYLDITIARDNNRNWGLLFKLDESTLSIISKIQSNSVNLLEVFSNISQGIIAYDKYRGQSEEIIKNRVFHYDKKVKENLKPWIKGRNVKRYDLDKDYTEYVDYCDGLANPREPKYFIGERILIREITNPRIFATLTKEEIYYDPGVITILGNNQNQIYSLLGIINSKLATFYHFNSSPKATKGEFPKLLIEDIKTFPLKLNQKQSFEEIGLLAKKLISKKNNEWSEEIDLVDKKLDQLVYKLYGLTEQEMKTVEESF